MGEPIMLLMLLAVLLAPVGLWLLAHRPEVARAVTGSDGVQEMTIVVRGNYRPATIVARRGVPLRLLFDRQEDDPCSERVIFSDFQQERRLAPFATTAVQFIPARTGEFLFTYAMGMYQGRLLVEEPRPVSRVTPLLRAPGLALHALGHGQPTDQASEVPGQSGGGDSRQKGD